MSAVEILDGPVVSEAMDDGYDSSVSCARRKPAPIPVRENEGDPIQLSEDLVARFLCDPVMAATVLMSADLDVFQRVRLRYMWFFPELIDSSGISTAKSEVVFIWANLVAMLLTNPEGEAKRKVVVFYQTLAVAEDTFWAKYDKYIERSWVFKSQLKVGRGGKYGTSTKNGKIQTFLNGNTVQIMAGAFNRDSDTLASMRCTDAAVDEFTVVDKMGRGIDLQLRGRATGATFNKNHPLWSNHIVLLGHAEGSDHPSNKRVVALRKAIRDGGFGHGLFTSCYLDYRGRYKRYLDEKEVKRGKVSLSKMEFDWVWLGVNRGGSRGYYDSKDRELVYSREVLPEFKRTHSSLIYTMGADVSYGTGRKIDDNAVVVLRSRYLGSVPPASMAGVYDLEGEYWEIKPAWAVVMAGQSVDQYAGVIHLLHQKFGLSVIVMDPSGGGGFVYRKLPDKKQLIEGSWKSVAGICMEEQSSLYPEADPVFRFFKRGDPVLDQLWDQNQMRGDEGIVEGAHDLLSKAFSTNSISWPLPLSERSKVEREGIPFPDMEILGHLEKVQTQLGNVHVVTNTQGETRFSLRGFRMFKAKGKKDGAYALLYAFAGTIAYLKSLSAEDKDGDEDDFIA